MKRYKIFEPIGAGGLGTVYRALDRLTGRMVALKRVERLHGIELSAATEATLLQNLTHEFSLLAGLRHPNIITVLDYGFETANQPYFTMELLTDAQTIIDAARTAADTTRIALLIELLQALIYLHRRGILHRDLKPANVLVDGGKVRVLDFGLAAPVQVTGALAGTVAYMPPEMLLDQHYSPTSDLYVVGLLAVEMFTGRLPFPTGDVLALLEQSPDLSGLQDERLRAVVARLLDTDPARRFDSAEAALHALAEIARLPVVEQPAVRDSYLQAAPFIGRQTELAQLEAALDRAMAGRGAALLIGGESGVGKSRLLNELRIRALTAGARVHSGQPGPDGGLPYQLWRQPLAHLAIESDLDALTDLELGVIKEVLPEVERFVGRPVSLPPPLDAAASSQRLAYVIIVLLQRLGQPVVLLLEDLHEADESLVVLETVSRAAPRLPLLLLGTYRSEEAPHITDHLTVMTLLTLDRFDRFETEQICTLMIGAPGTNPMLVRRLQQESDGNVFFLIEILRQLAEQTGSLAEVGAAEMPSPLLPEGISTVMERRLAFVPDWAQPLLKLAAVAGRQIEPDLLSRAADEPINIDDWLYTCAAAAVLEIRDNQWRFAHDKLREALLQMMPEMERAAYHARLAASIEQVYAADPAWAVSLANHWREAGQVDRALDYALRAGDYLSRTGGYADLRILAENSLALLRPNHDDWLRLKLWDFLGEGCRFSDVETAQSAFQEVLALCERHGWEPAVTAALRGLIIIYRDQGEVDRAEQLTDQLLSYARQHDDPTLLTPALTLKARFFLMRGEYDRARSYYEQGLAYARAADDAMKVATVLMNLGAVACMQGHFDEGQRFFHEAEVAAEASGAIDIVVYCLLNQANLASDRVDYASAEVYFDRSMPMIETLGEFSLLAGAYFDRGDLALRQHKLDEARLWYRKSRELAEHLQNHRRLSDALHGLGKVAYLTRDYRTAQQYMEAGLQHATEVQAVPDQITNLNYLTMIHLKLGQTRAARQALIDGLKHANSLESNLPQLEILPAAAEMLLFLERPERAAELYGLARYHPEALPGNVDLLDALYPQLEGELDPDELGDAVGRGQQLDLAATISSLFDEIPAA